MSSATYLQPIASPSQSIAQDYQTIQAQPLNGALGAEVSGVDLRSVDDAVFEEIHAALIRHQVLVFRDQTLSPEHLVSLGQQFGELHVNPFVKGLDGYPEVIPIRSEENHEKRFTGLWHSDISWGEEPSLGSLLYAVEVPEFGGDTLFGNMYVACQTLSEGMKKLLSGLRAAHSANRYHSSTAKHADYSVEGVLHPVIRTHPVSGEQALFVNEYFTTHFEDMTEAESEPLLNYLFTHAVRPDFTCRIHWEPGTLVIWDNRCTQHYATNDYPGQSRLMHRVTVKGDRPV